MIPQSPRPPPGAYAVVHPQNALELPALRPRPSPVLLTELQAPARSTGDSPVRSVSNTFIFSTRQVRAVSVASPTFSYTPLAWRVRAHRE